jgi:hypothetical protein
MAYQQSISEIAEPTAQQTGGSPYNVKNAKNWSGFTNQVQNVRAQASPYEEQVQSGQYLDLRNNPWAQGYADAIGQNFQEQMGRQLSQVSSPFAGAGGTMGMSGIHGALRGITEDQGSQNLANELAQMYAGLYSGERGLQQAVSSDLSQRTNQLRGVAGQAYSADQSRIAQITSARIGAKAAISQARMHFRMGQDQLAYDKLRDAEMFKQREYALMTDRYRLELGAQDLFGSNYDQGPQVSPNAAWAQDAYQTWSQGGGWDQISDWLASRGTPPEPSGAPDVSSQPYWNA